MRASRFAFRVPARIVSDRVFIGAFSGALILCCSGPRRPPFPSPDSESARKTAEDALHESSGERDGARFRPRFENAFFGSCGETPAYISGACSWSACLARVSGMCPAKSAYRQVRIGPRLNKLRFAFRISKTTEARRRRLSAGRRRLSAAGAGQCSATLQVVQVGPTLGGTPG